MEVYKMNLFLNIVLPKVADIQTIKQKSCPKCKRRMYLARHFSMWTCEKCDIEIAFTKEEIKLVNKYERKMGLSQTGKGKFLPKRRTA
jgi:ribosomal protein L37AE/L43A